MKREFRLLGDPPTPPPIEEGEEGNGEDETEGVPDTVNPDPR